MAPAARGGEAVGGRGLRLRRLGGVVRGGESGGARAGNAAPRRGVCSDGAGERRAAPRGGARARRR